MQAQFRTNCNHRTTGVVDTLTEQILTETTALTLDHVSERLERTLVGTSHRLAATAVVEKRIHSFLQHTLFIADDDIGSLDLKDRHDHPFRLDARSLESLKHFQTLGVLFDLSFGIGRREFIAQAQNFSIDINRA